MRTLKHILLGTLAGLLSSVGVHAQNGNGWSSAGPKNVAGRVLSVHVDVTTSERIYAGTAGGGFWTSTNGGQSWNHCDSLKGSPAIAAIAQSNDGTLYIGTGEGLNMSYADPGVETNNRPYGIKGDGVYKSSNKGMTFERLPNTEIWTDVNAIAYDNVNGKLYVATNEGLKVSSDGGATFVEAIPSNYSRGVSLKAGSDGTVIYADFDGEGGVYVSTGGGAFNPVGSSLPITGSGRISVDIAPTKPNMVYAMVSLRDGSFAGVYASEDKGQNWQVIFPSESSQFDPMSNWGHYCNAIAVSLTDSSKVLVGGLYLYEVINRTGQVGYALTRISGATHIHSICYADSNKAYLGTNTGVSVINTATGAVSSCNNSLATLQAYTLGIGNDSRLMVGTRDNGTILIANPGAPAKIGKELPITFPNKSIASDGADCVFSTISDALFFTASYGYCCRQASLISEPQLPSQWMGGSSVDKGTVQGGYFHLNIINKGSGKEFTRWYYSTKPSDDESGLKNSYANIYVSPLAIWESVNDENSIDSVVFIADKTYIKGDDICVKSKRNGYPIWMKYTGEDTLRRENDDTWKVKDIVTSRLFIGGSGSVSMGGALIFMTTEALDFVNSSRFSCVFRTKDTTEQVMKMLPSKDGNHLFVLTKKYTGMELYSIYRVSGFDMYRTYEEMDVSARIHDVEAGLNAENLLRMLEDNTLVENYPFDILDIALDPQNSNTLIYTTANNGMRINAITDALIATGGVASIVAKEGSGLPIDAAVYCAVVEMSGSDAVYIGTEEGVYKTENFTDPNPQWELYNKGINAKVPVFKMYQQANFVPTARSVSYDAQGKPDYKYFQGVANCGTLYAATHGLGVFMDSTHWDKIPEPYFPFHKPESVNLNVFPNPANNSITVDFTLAATNNVQISITDITGKTILTKSLGARMIGDYQEKIDCSALSEGLYFVTVNAGYQNQSAKIIISK